jgi:hypothetical protein
METVLGICQRRGLILSVFIVYLNIKI